MYIHISACIHVCVCVWMSMCVHTVYTHRCMHTSVCVCVCVCSLCAFMYVWIFTFPQSETVKTMDEETIFKTVSVVLRSDR